MPAARRYGSLVTLAASIALLWGCGGGSVTLTPTPPKVVNYTAVGASDAVGYGASITCNPAQVPPLTAVPACPGGTGYVPVIARTLARDEAAQVNLVDLGISGAVIGPDIRADGDLYGPNCETPRAPADAIPADFITDELPKIPANTTLVTIFAGGNDTNAIVNAAACQALLGATTAQVTAYLNAEVGKFGADLQSLLQAIAAKTGGKAKVVVADLPNFANLPFANGTSAAGAPPLPAGVRALLQLVAVTGIDQLVYLAFANPPNNVPTVDLLCPAASYNVANYYLDGFHPNDAGYALMAQLYVAQILAAKPAVPSFSCPAATAFAGRANASGMRGIPNFDRR